MKFMSEFEFGFVVKIRVAIPINYNCNSSWCTSCDFRQTKDSSLGNDNSDFEFKYILGCTDWLTVFPPQCCLLQTRFSSAGFDVFKELDNYIVDNSSRN